MIKIHHRYSYKSYSVVFDFEECCIRIREDIPIDIWTEMKNDEEFNFLLECLAFEFDFREGTFIVSEQEFIKRYFELCIQYREKYSV